MPILLPVWQAPPSKTPYAGHGRTETPNGPVSVGGPAAGLSLVAVSAEARNRLTNAEI